MYLVAAAKATGMLGAIQQLLSFCQANGFSVMNTWFQKPSKNQITWQHPRTKEYHCIDDIILSLSDIETFVWMLKQCREPTVGVIITSFGASLSLANKKGQKPANV